MTAFNSDFGIQYFILTPNSIYEESGDEVEGIVSPYESLLVEVDTEPYCKIKSERYEYLFNLYNSIGVIE